MSEEEQRIAIAEACGWTKTWAEKGTGQMEFHSHPVPLPDYLNDLNAMHEAEKILNVSDEQIEHWEQMLTEICERDNIILLMATAAQRAEAFLKTIGKWVYSQTKNGLRGLA